MKRLCTLGLCCLLALSPVPATALMASNLELLTQAADAAVRDALERVPLSSPADGWQVPLLLESQDTHDANWLVEQLLAEQLLASGLPITTDATAVEAGAPRLAYRIVDLGITGKSRLLSGNVERSCRVTIGLRFSDAGELVALGEAKAQLSDVIPGRQLETLQHSKHKFADTSLEKRSWERFAEPFIVTTVLGSLIYLFFSNR
ncbi:MAG: hypothetical protein HN712_15905 [Gemmatimonadetes bacterium]|jgi:hypothetical protein|nr:hypothetical protein [Gemmatimonadota bacterium]MBT6145177.1 hypothetical protein [Gemmatimonadota bacterium]MBT7861805.1 hypothetical protein [Gemmatimonadota bacterium]